MTKEEAIKYLKQFYPNGGYTWLDELDPSRGDKVKPIPIQCGIVCEIEFADIMDERTQLIMQGKMSIRDVR